MNKCFGDTTLNTNSDRNFKYLLIVHFNNY